MRILKPSQFDRANIRTPRVRLFLQLWSRLVDYNTPITYQARHMYAPSLLREISVIAEDCERQGRVTGYLRAAAEEAVNSDFGVVRKDPFASQVAGHEYPVLINILENAKKGEVSHRRNYGVLSDVSRQIAEKTLEAYRGRLGDELLDAMFSDQEDATPERVEVLTQRLMSHLLDQGHSPSRLFNLISPVFSRHSVSVKNRVEHLLQVLDFGDLVYRVVFRLESASGSHVPELCRLGFPVKVREDFKFDVDRVYHSLAKKRIPQFCKEEEGRVWVEVQDVEAPDEFGAAIKAKECLQKWLMSIRIRSQTRGLEPPARQCLVYREDAPKHVRVLEAHQTDALSRFGPDPATSGDAENWLCEAVGQKEFWTDEPAAFRYVQALQEEDIETAFDLLWRSLECLSEPGAPENIIDRVVDTVAKPLAIRAARRNLRFLVGQIGACDEVDLAPVVESEDCQSILQSGSPDALLYWAELFLDGEGTEDLQRAFDGYEALKKLIGDLEQGVFKGPTHIADRLERSRLSVEWELRRIYRHRNMIVHDSISGESLVRLYHHLRWYVYQLFRIIAFDSENRGKEFLQVENARCDALIGKLYKNRPYDRRQLFI